MIRALILIVACFLNLFSAGKSLGVQARVLSNTDIWHTSSLKNELSAPNLTINLSFSGSLSTGATTCFEPDPSRPRTNVNDCRSTLREIVNRPDRGLVQEFVMNKRPTKPHPPPYGFHKIDSNCVVEVFAISTLVKDRFSFVQVKDLAQQILQDCEDAGKGAGGRAGIGNNIGWLVVVQGDRGPGQELKEF